MLAGWVSCASQKKEELKSDKDVNNQTYVGNLNEQFINENAIEDDTTDGNVINKSDDLFEETNLKKISTLDIIPSRLVIKQPTIAEMLVGNNNKSEESYDSLSNSQITQIHSVNKLQASDQYINNRNGQDRCSTESDSLNNDEVIENLNGECSNSALKNIEFDKSKKKSLKMRVKDLKKDVDLLLKAINNSIEDIRTFEEAIKKLTQELYLFHMECDLLRNHTTIKQIEDNEEIFREIKQEYAVVGSKIEKIKQQVSNASFH